MSFPTWTPDAVSSEARRCSEKIWRIVESQHIASTMKLVDTLAEQELLEDILEQSKPPLLPAARDFDYLLTAPFRYIPFHPGSRFRAPTDSGVFYGAESVRTAAAEVGYWRWRFLRETAGLQRLGPVSHTAFSVAIDARGVDLRLPPFDQGEAAWMHPSDYGATQAFGRIAREAGIETIIYRSVRAPEPGWCAAVLTPTAFSTKEPDSAMQTWHLVVTGSEAIWRREHGGTFSFPTTRWEHP